MPRLPSVLFPAVLLSLLFAVTVQAAAEVSRPEYVARLEKICKPDSLATQGAVHGTRADVRAERFRQAAAKVAKAERIFSGTVRKISKAPRPAADRETLSRWFSTLKLEVAALGRTAAALRSEDLPRFQRVWANFIHEGNKANNVVVSFGFDYCAFKPSRFQ